MTVVLSGFFWRDDRCHTLIFSLFDNRIAVVPLVGNQVFRREAFIRRPACVQSAAVPCVITTLSGIPCASTARCTGVEPPFVRLMSWLPPFAPAACGCTLQWLASGHHQPFIIRLAQSEHPAMLPIRRCRASGRTAAARSSSRPSPAANPAMERPFAKSSISR